MNYKKTRIFILLSFFILLAAFKIPHLKIPAFADEFNYINGILTVYDNHLNPFIDFWSYKPPVFFVSISALFKIFGQSLVVARLFMLFSALLLLSFTFLLGEKIYGKKTAFFASLLLLFSPIFIEHAGFISCDTLLAALAVASIYFFITGRKIVYLITASLLVLTKESGVLVIVGIALYKFIITLSGIENEDGHYKAKPNSLKKLIAEILFIISPLSLFFIWMLINKMALGWFLYPINVSLVKGFAVTKYAFLGTFLMVVNGIFISQFRFSITAVILLTAFISLYNDSVRKRFVRKELILFALLIIIFVFSFSVLSGWPYYSSPRYFLFIHSFIFISGAAAIIALVKNRVFHTVIFLIISVLFICGGNINIGESAVGHIDAVMPIKKAAEFLKSNFPSEMIIANPIIKTALENPIYGYLNEPMANVVILPPVNKKTRQETSQIIIVTSEYYKNWFLGIASTIDKLIEDSKARVVKVFESNKGMEKVTIYLMGQNE